MGQTLRLWFANPFCNMLAASLLDSLSSYPGFHYSVEISIEKVEDRLKLGRSLLVKPQFSSVQSLSHVQLCAPMDCSMPGLPIHHQHPEFTQTHVHWVGDAIQPSHLLSSPSPPAINLSQHQVLFKWVSSSYQVAKVLEFQLQLQLVIIQWLLYLSG